MTRNSTQGVYALVNKINGYAYVGQSKNVFNRINSHKKEYYTGKTKIHQAILLYGWNNFYTVTLEFVDNCDELCRKEELWIEKLNSYTDCGYNNTAGGRGFSSKTTQRRLQLGLHNWQGISGSTHSKKLSKKRIANGTHNFSGKLGSQANKKRIANGTHNFLGPEPNNKRIREGTHPFVKKVECPHCGKVMSKATASRWHFTNCTNNPEN